MKRAISNRRNRWSWAILGQYRLILVIFIILIVAGGGATAFSIHRNDVRAKAQRQRQYNSELASIESLRQRLVKEWQQFVNLPDSTTKTRSDWDNYFSATEGRIQDIATSSSKLTFPDSSSLNRYNNNVSTAASDFINLINLDKALQDMGFQVQSDQNQLNIDQSTLTNERQIYDESVSAGVPIGNGYVTEFQTAVTNDKNQLAADQQTQQSQKTQTDNMAAAMILDIAKINGPNAAL